MASSYTSSHHQQSPLTLGIMGLGAVGAALVRQLEAQKDRITQTVGRELRITHVCVRDPSRPRDCVLPSGATFTADPAELVSATDLVVELAGGMGPAIIALYKAAQKLGRPVVTANKAWLAQSDFLAQSPAMALGLEAAVGAGVPIVHTLHRLARSNTISSIQGILNGTSNHILSTMESGSQTYAQALALSQEQGLAEADPTLDINGTDTAHKLALLIWLACGRLPDISAMLVRGIVGIDTVDIEHARRMGRCIRLMGQSVWPTETEANHHAPPVADVAPVLVPQESPWAQTTGANNRMALVTNPQGAVSITGVGAGGDVTAGAVINDIVDAALGQMLVPHPPSLDRSLSAHEPVYPHYIRVSCANVHNAAPTSQPLQKALDQALAVHAIAAQPLEQGNNKDCADFLAVITDPIAPSRAWNAVTNLAGMSMDAVALRLI